MFLKKLALGLLLYLIVPVALIAAVDFFWGDQLNHIISGDAAANRLETAYRIKDSLYDHTLAPSHMGIGVWGRDKYQICTNASGFKDSCANVKSAQKNFDIAFIGDSFTEGIGLPYEETFVGQIAHGLPDMSVANLAVASYAPSIYLVKIRDLINRGYSFKEVVVYVDISDIQDEAIYYKIKNGKVIHRAPPPRFPLFARARTTLLQALGRIPPGLGPSYRDRDFHRSAWTYNPQTGGYGAFGVQGGIAKSLKLMDELYQFLHERGIPMSVGVYPWPGQLLYDQRESLQVTTWRTFCETRCKHFFNSFPTFFDLRDRLGAEETLAEYFTPHDVHFNKMGSALVAQDFLNAYAH